MVLPSPYLTRMNNDTWKNVISLQLGSVAGSVIQATGKLRREEDVHWGAPQLT